MAKVADANQETYEAWNGVLFDRFLKYRHLVVEGLGTHGTAAMRRYPPEPGQRVLDIGCGFGDTTQELARIVGAAGHATGVDIAERFIEHSRKEAEDAGVESIEFHVADVQTAPLDGPFDYVYSRMGVMFFANPVVALRNVREAMTPGARFVAAVWRRREDNDWMHRAELIVKPWVQEDPDSDEPTCGPGPFSMANADTVSAQLLGAGFEEVQLTRYEADIVIGESLDEAVELMTALGPAGEAIRLAGEQADEVRPQIEAALREALTDFQTDAGAIAAPASTWTIAARAPAG